MTAAMIAAMWLPGHASAGTPGCALLPAVAATWTAMRATASGRRARLPLVLDLAVMASLLLIQWHTARPSGSGMDMTSTDGAAPGCGLPQAAAPLLLADRPRRTRSYFAVAAMAGAVGLMLA
jgi:hypothetical protein